MSRSTWKIIYYITFASLIGAFVNYLAVGASGVINGLFTGMIVGAVLVFLTYLFTEF